MGAALSLETIDASAQPLQTHASVDLSGRRPSVAHAQVIERQMVADIATTTARLDDEAEMAKSLSPIPNGDRLAEVLKDRKPVSTRAY